MTAESSRPERLRRLETIFVRSPIYFVTACTSHRRKILATPAIHESFVQFAKEGLKHGAWIGGYVLMPDHFHLFVAVDDERLILAEWVKSLKNTLSKTLRSEKIQAPHFQKGFFDHLLRSLFGKPGGYDELVAVVVLSEDAVGSHGRLLP